MYIRLRWEEAVILNDHNPDQTIFYDVSVMVFCHLWWFVPSQ